MANGKIQEKGNEMHLYVIARGMKDKLDRWVNDLTAIYLPVEAHNPVINQRVRGSLQLSVRPIQLYEIVFPADQKKFVLDTINPKGWGTNPMINVLRKFLYKILGCTERVEHKDNLSMFSGIHNCIDLLPIGLRKDEWMHIVEETDKSGARIVKHIRTRERLHKGVQGVEDL